MRGLRRNDWMKFHCGDRVYDRANPRHRGRVEAVIQGLVTVKWDNGWKSVGVSQSDLAKE